MLRRGDIDITHIAGQATYPPPARAAGDRPPTGDGSSREVEPPSTSSGRESVNAADLSRHGGSGARSEPDTKKELLIDERSGGSSTDSNASTDNAALISDGSDPRTSGGSAAGQGDAIVGWIALRKHMRAECAAHPLHGALSVLTVAIVLGMYIIFG